MSLILEALRKSEAERQRDGAPNVAMELPPVPPRRDGATPAWVWPTLAVVVAGAALAGWLGMRAGKRLQTGDAAALAPVATANAPEPASTSTASTSTAATLPPPPSATPAPAPQPPTATAALPTPPVPPAPAPLPPLPTPAPAPAPADDVRVTAHAVPPPPPLPPVAARPAPAPAAPAITPDPADAPPIGATGLPPVKLSMHMWDADPSKRFVILDGQRMGEGDRNGALQVVAILRNGVIIERAGIRARVPLP